MTDYSKLTVGDVTQGIAQTKAALKRAQELIDKAGMLASKPPSVLAILAESTLKLRDHLEVDLKALENALEEANKR